MKRCHRPLPTVVLTYSTVVLALACFTAVLPAETLRAGDDLRLARAEGAYTVAWGGDEAVALPLTNRALVYDFRSAGPFWWVAAVDRDAGGSSLALFEGRDGVFDALPEPAVGAVRVVRDPQLLTGEGELRGVAWLEGDAVTRLQVRAAWRKDSGWTTPVTISPPGLGSQLALTVAGLADGSWLAAWSAFDGRDDEILWSRFAAGIWSPPRNVADDNPVPDVTPRLARCGSGALLAWTRYDGNDYRIHTARFDGGAWTAPAQIGPPGSVDPGFSKDAFALLEKPLLVFRRAVPEGWLAAELDASGKIVRTSSAAAPPDDSRPAVASVRADGVVLDWAEASATLPWPSP